jgi:hypothetical protein
LQTSYDPSRWQCEGDDYCMWTGSTCTDGAI